MLGKDKKKLKKSKGKTCSSCKHICKTESENFNHKSVEGIKVYDCHRFPPTIMMGSHSNTKGFAVAYPYVGKDTPACGEYKAGGK